MASREKKTAVLFVCMGNICRSPTAEGVFRHVVKEAGLDDQFEIDSAGTHAYHVGEPPDRRAMAASERRGISLADISARRVHENDFDKFDYIIAMDEENQRRLLDLAPADYPGKIQLFLDFASGEEMEVPDPYYGGSAGFERVLDLIEAASQGFLNETRPR